MTHYKVKATIEVEYDAIRSDKTSSAWEEAESRIGAALSRLKFLSACKFKEVEVQMEDY